MITFKRHLIESMSSSYSVEIENTNSTNHTFKFTDENNVVYEASFTVQVFTFYDKARIMDITFTASTNSQRETMAITGKARNALKVYSTIGQELRKYMAKHPVDALIFTSVDDRTMNVYAQLAKRIAVYVGGKLIAGRTNSNFIIDITGKAVRA